jgi:tetratricopeptide (TPR) repeat protein
MRGVLVGALLLVPPVLLFAPGLAYPFLGLDDVYAIVTNPAIRDLSWDGVRFLFLEDARDLRYFPITYLSWALDYRLFGLDPFGFHLNNLLLHLANVLLVYALVRSLTRDKIAAGVAGLLFAIHPLQVESVIWVSSRKNVLFLFFFLLAIFAYLLYVRSRREHRGLATLALATSVLLYLASCLAKTTGVTLPAVLFLIDIHREPHPWRGFGALLRTSLPSKLAYLPPALAVYAVTRVLAQESPFRTEYAYSPLEWGAIVGHNLFFYVMKTAVPSGLGVFYSLPEPGALPLHVYVYAALAVALVGITFWCARRGPPVVFLGLAWYLVTIFPLAVFAAVLSDLPILVADRYYYQSAIGVGIVVGAAASALWRRRPGLRVPVLVAGAAMGAAAFALAAEHRAAWRGTIPLSENLLENHPTDEFYYRLALAYDSAGRPQAAFGALEEAERAPRKIFFLDLFRYQLRLSDIHRRKGDVAGAAAFLEAAIEATPNRMEPFDARTPLAYRYLAHLQERAGDPRRAAASRARASRTQADPEHHFELAWFHVAPGAAGAFLEQRIAEEPRDAMAWYHFGTLARLQGREDLARERFERAARLGYGSPPAVSPPAGAPPAEGRGAYR